MASIARRRKTISPSLPRKEFSFLLVNDPSKGTAARPDQHCRAPCPPKWVASEQVRMAWNSMPMGRKRLTGRR